ncbi:Hypothetical predicted protein [Mytilus galloprovincialis]|uniref:CARD domain-containing protein n=1 Tax=Mytilus galloprovincialis TaxID=29158 RepID=A0A8B6CND9_MYTGA|nr:Hypothetical predicted protein [Mytilus galloprovincialis]
MAQTVSEMDVLEKKVRDNIPYLQEHISDVKIIVDYLIEMHVINLNDKTKFLNDRISRKDQIHDILEEIITRKKFDVLIKALEKTDNDTAVEILTTNDKEFADFIENQEEAVGSSTKDIAKLEAEKSTLEIDLAHIQTVERDIRKLLEEKTTRIEASQTGNNDKKQLEKDVKKLQEELKVLNKEYKEKTEFVKTITQQYDEVVALNKILQDQKREKDRKERDNDREQREEDRKERDHDKEQREKDREQREKERQERDHDRDQREKDRKEREIDREERVKERKLRDLEREKRDQDREEDKKERNKDREERKEDRKLRGQENEERKKDIEQREKEREQREKDTQSHEQLHKNVDLILQIIGQQNTKDGKCGRNETSEASETREASEANGPPVLRKNNAYDLRTESIRKNYRM